MHHYNSNAYEQLHARIFEQSGGGIWPRSSSNTYFIFCVGQTIVKINAFMSWALHHDVQVKPLLGQYKGQAERSFIANTTDLERIRPWFTDEESVLFIGACNDKGEPKATLHYLRDGRSVDLGHMKNVSREEALTFDSWTYDPVFKRYFVTKNDAVVA